MEDFRTDLHEFIGHEFREMREEIARWPSALYQPPTALTGGPSAALGGVSADFGSLLKISGGFNPPIESAGSFLTSFLGSPNLAAIRGSSEGVDFESLNKDLGIYPTAMSSTIFAGKGHLSFADGHYDPIAPAHGFDLLVAGSVLSGSSTDSAVSDPLSFTPTTALGGANSIVAEAGQLSLSSGLYDPIASVHSVGLQAISYILPSGSSASAADDSSSAMPFVGVGSLVTGLARSLFSDSSYDPTAALHGMGPQPASYILPSGSTIGAAMERGSSMMPFASTGSVIKGTDYLSFSSIPNDLTASAQGVGVQLVSYTPPGGSTAGGSVDSLWLRSTNPFAGASSIVTGTDYPSLSKSISDLTATGHIITGWTLTYLTVESQ
jgi:hypothetical protein